MLCLFLANLEVSIVSTSLVSITDDLQGFSRTSWIVSGYLLTYTGMASTVVLPREKIFPYRIASFHHYLG